MPLHFHIMSEYVASTELGRDDTKKVTTLFHKKQVKLMEHRKGIEGNHFILNNVSFV